MTETHTHYTVTIWFSDPDDREIVDIVDRGYYHPPEAVYAPIEEIVRTYRSRGAALAFVARIEAEHGQVWSEIREETIRLPEDTEIPF